MRRQHAIVLAALLALATQGAAAPSAKPGPWIATWGTSQLALDDKTGLPPVRGKAGVTIRQTMRISAGGAELRLRLSNAFGDAPLAIGRARIEGGGRSVPLTFSGRPGTDIPAAAEAYSDPVALTLPAGADLTITLHLPELPEHQTGHPGARATTRVAPGDQVDAATLTDVATVPRWFVIADVEVRGRADATIVAIGDSITDGYGVQPDTHARWTDAFAARLRGNRATAHMGLVNAGIGGNRVTLDGTGPNLLARFDREVIARSGVKYAILFEGVNDIGTFTRDKDATPAEHAALVRRITAGYTQAVDRAHAHGIKVIGATVTPLVGNDYYHAGPATEADRQMVNAFIRTSGLFDAVLDFDAVVRDPARPDRLAPAYDSGDHLHPSLAGYRRMGEAVPLDLFTRPLPPPRRAQPAIAFTFDDIPAHSDLPPGETRASVMKAIAGTLKAGGVPAYGFLNAGFGVGDPTAPAAIAAWRTAGLPVGNHGHDHRNLNTLDAKGFAEQVVSNEGAVDAANGGPAPRWFRYPYLSEGDTPALRDAARKTLAERGYRIAAVTMSFADFNYNPPYARCMAKRDMDAVALLERGWLASVRRDALEQRARTQALYGRDIPFVLLMHVGAFDARMLPRTIALYRQLGFRFASLAEAQTDPLYASANDPRLPGPTLSLERAAAEAGLPLIAHPAGDVPSSATLQALCR